MRGALLVQPLTTPIQYVRSATFCLCPSSPPTFLATSVLQSPSLPAVPLTASSPSSRS